VCEDARLEIIEASLTGDVVLDHALQVIQASKRPRKIPFWLKYFGERQRWTIKEIQDCLVAAGILSQEDENDFRWVIPAPNFPQREANARYWLKDQLRAAVFAGEEIDLHMLTLLSLVFYGKLERLVFTKDERRFGRQSIHQRLVREILSNWGAQFIEEIGHAVKAY
jgi:hypothetical protein